MVLSSHLFVYYFLPLALLVYFLLPTRGRNLALTVVSYGFYGWANPYFVLLMFGSTVIDYFCGLTVSGQFRQSWSKPIQSLPIGAGRTRRQRTALLISIISNHG